VWHNEFKEALPFGRASFYLAIDFLALWSAECKTYFLSAGSPNLFFQSIMS